MVKKISIALITLCLLVLSGCTAKSSDTLTGTPADLLPTLLQSANSKLPDDVKIVNVERGPLLADKSATNLGLSADDFGRLVDSAEEAMAMLTTTAQTTVVVKAKSASDATEVATLIASGFDSEKWICVMPQRSLTVTSGSYVLLAVGSIAQTQALVDAFTTLAGDTAGQPHVFFTSA